jgi:hypothetical protein
MLIDQMKIATEYMNNMVRELNIFILNAHMFLETGRADEAKKELLLGYEYHKQREDNLDAHDFGFTRDELRPKRGDVDFKTILAAYNQAEHELAVIMEKLDAVYKLTSTAATLEEAANQAEKVREAADKQYKNAQDAAQEAIGKYEELMGIKKEANFDMQILGGFIATLGIAAVAIAFVALNAAGLALSGVLLAGFGVGAALLGCSIFSSTAKNMDEYADNVYESFGAATAAV